MATVTVHHPRALVQMLMSLMSFTQNAKFELTPDGMMAAVQCDNPHRLRINVQSNAMSCDDEISLCVKEISRLHRAISMVVDYCKKEGQSFTMTATDRADQLIYDNGRLKFRIGMVNERAIGESVDTRNFPSGADFRYVVSLDPSAIKYLFRQSSIVRSKDAKVYLIQNPDGSISGQLEDKTAKHCGMIAYPLADKIAKGSFAPSVIAADKVHNLVKLPGDRVILTQLQNEFYLAQSVFQEGDYFIRFDLVFSPTLDDAKK